jgi:hypothetical protein
MSIIRLAGTCPDGHTCPAIFKTDAGTLIIQGRHVQPEALGDLGLGDGECAVEIPADLLRRVVDQC